LNRKNKSYKNKLLKTRRRRKKISWWSLVTTKMHNEKKNHWNQPIIAAIKYKNEQMVLPLKKKKIKTNEIDDYYLKHIKQTNKQTHILTY